MVEHAWAFDLVDPDDGRRHAALDRHRALLEAASAALCRMNEIWARTGSFAPADRPSAAAMDQAHAEFRANRDGTLFGPISARDARYAVLFLRWEARYPDEWRAASPWTWSHWGTKEGLLRWFATAGVPGAVRADVAELILDALRRPYRCKDWRYAALLRHVADPSLLDRIRLLAGGDRRARFLLHVAAHPGERITMNSYRLYDV